MSLLQNFDAETIEPNEGFDDVPEGKYVAEIIAAEEKTTNKGDGQYLALTWQISAGPLTGRRLWVNLNLANPSAEAVKIAEGQLSAICRAIGVMRPRTGNDLLLKRCIVTVKHKSKDGKNDVRVTKFEPLTPDGGTAAPTASGSARAKAPWNRKA